MIHLQLYLLCVLGCWLPGWWAASKLTNGGKDSNSNAVYLMVALGAASIFATLPFAIIEIVLLLTGGVK